MKIVTNGELKNFAIKKELASLRFELPLSEVNNYLGLCNSIGGKEIKIQAKADQSKFNIGLFLGKTLKIDLKNGIGTLDVDADLDDLKTSIEDIKTMQGLIMTLCFVINNEEEE